MFSARAPGAEAVPGMMSLPGIRSVQRYLTVKADTPDSTLPAHLAIYPIDAADLAATRAERTAPSHATPSSGVGQIPDVALPYRPAGPLVLARDVPGSSAPVMSAAGGPLEKMSLVVLSNASKGQEAEYEAWYDQQHVPDVLRIPGFVSGQRYVLNRALAPNAVVPKYMVVFDFETNDLEATIADLKRRNRTGVTKMSPAFDTAGVHVYYCLRLPGSQARK